MLRDDTAPADGVAADDAAGEVASGAGCAESRQWSLREAIEFASQWKNKDEMIKNKPGVDEETWEEVMVVFDLSQKYGTDQGVIYEKLVAHFEGEKIPIDPFVRDEHGQVRPMTIEAAMTALQDCGFDKATSDNLLARCDGCVDRAIELGRNENLKSRAETGEFGDPTIALQEIEREQTNSDPTSSMVAISGEQAPADDTAETSGPPNDETRAKRMEKVVAYLEQQDSQYTPALSEYLKSAEDADNMQTVPIEIFDDEEGNIPEFDQGVPQSSDMQTDPANDARFDEKAAS